MKIEEIINKLVEGNSRYMNEDLDRSSIGITRRSTLTEGQAPYAIILSCSDSRVVPELIFDTGLGDLFVIRVAGNIASKSATASIEYAVAHLNVKLIVVLGHESCGAVKAAVKGGDYGDNLNELISYITPAIKNSKKGASIDDIIKKNAELTALTLVKHSSIIKEAVSKEELKIATAYYNLLTGKIDFL